MQRSALRSTLYFRLVMSLVLSVSVSLLLISCTRQHSHTSLFVSEPTDIANRILLVVRTSHNCQSRLQYLLRSWIPTDRSAQGNLYLTTDNVSSDTNLTVLNAFRNIIYTNCPTTHNSFDLCCKTAHEFQLFYDLSRTSRSVLDWMCRFDDDQYVNLDNLYKYLAQYDASQPYYIGRTSVKGRSRIRNDSRTFRFATYGAGVCYSRALLELLRPHVAVQVLPHRCLARTASDDAYMGYLSEIIVNVSLTSVNDLLHSHLEILDHSFRKFTLHDLTRIITFGFAWDRYKLDWLPIIHQLIQLVKQGQYEAADRLWLFLRNYEKEHPENLTDQYDQSCTSYQRLRNRTMMQRAKTTTYPVKKAVRKYQRQA
jgi:fringe protein